MILNCRIVVYYVDGASDDQATLSKLIFGSALKDK